LSVQRTAPRESRLARQSETPHINQNWLFIGETAARERSAILFTIIECCRRVAIDPYAQLRDVLTRPPRMTNWEVKDITPAAWAEALKPARSQPAA
jgi:hypothetical protein